MPFTYYHPLIGIGSSENSGRYPTENGFETRTTSTIAFDDATRTFTITPVGDCFYWNDGSRYQITAAESITIADTEGIHFVYIDGDTLKETSTFSESLITTYALVGVVYWDATNNVSIIFGDERHGRSMDSMVHLYHHSTEGAKWGKGLGPVEITHGNGNNAVDAQIGLEAGSIWDEDLKFDIPADARPINAPILYRSGATGLWRKIDSTGYICTTAGSGRAAYNEWTGATWQLTELTTNDYCCMHLLATNDQRHPMIWIVGQNRYTTLANAREGADIEWQSLQVGQLETLLPEFVAIATFILQTASGYGNAVKSKIVTLENGTSFVDLRKR